MLLHAALSCAFTLFGSFIWNAILSAVARLVTYALVCAAVPALRQRDPDAPRVRLPGGRLIPYFGLAFYVVLVTQMEVAHAGIAALVALAGLANWLWARRASHT